MLAVTSMLSPAVLCCCMLLPESAAAQQPPSTAQQIPFSTHDFSLMNGIQSDCWADTKTPGDGRTYSVGTTTISRGIGTSAAYSQFSGRDGMVDPDVDSGSLWPVTSANNKQVVVLQVADPTIVDGIAWQAFFFGGSSALSGGVLPNTYARAISVWPAKNASGAPDSVNTRIAICGETWDGELPRSLTPSRGGWSTGTAASGFVAMYDGTGELLWSYQFYGEDLGAHTVIADLVVQRVGSDDVITYCGASMNGDFHDGNPLTTSTMSPLDWFDPLGPGQSAGNVHNAVACTGQPPPPHVNCVPTLRWDGIVGRMSVAHTPYASAQGPVDRKFHAIVGGRGNDGLFGLSLAPGAPDIICVVGSASNETQAAGLSFPFLFQSYGGHVLQWQSNWKTGVVMTLQDSGVAGNPLVVLGSAPLGDPVYTTFARDVIWHDDQIYVVGSTDDPGFGVGGNPVAALAGVADGFVALCDIACNTTWASHLGLCPAKPGIPSYAAGAVGISAWNEYLDHVAIVGWSRRSHQAGWYASPSRIVVGNFFREQSSGPIAHLTRVMQYEIDEVGLPTVQRVDAPGAATTSFGEALTQGSFANSSAWLGEPAGGGVAVDSRGLVTVVGSSHYPVAALTMEYPSAGNALQRRVAEATSLANTDAVRSLVSLLPNGVCRTDGLVCSLGWALAPGSSGGTSPQCALRWYGNTLATPASPTPLGRMFIDFDGVPAAGSAASVLVDRPPVGVISLGFLQVGLPGNAPLSSPDAPGLDLWGNGQASVWLPWFLPAGSFRQLLWPGLPAGPAQFSLQFVSLIVFTSPGTSFCGNPGWDFAASPALMVSY